jgi:hypothetical protein
MLIWPLSTLKTCGNSSRRILRRKLPTSVTRWSSSNLIDSSSSGGRIGLLLNKTGMLRASVTSIGGGCSLWRSGGGTRCLTYALVACVLEA